MESDRQILGGKEQGKYLVWKEKGSFRDKENKRREGKESNNFLKSLLVDGILLRSYAWP